MTRQTKIAAAVVVVVLVVGSSRIGESKSLLANGATHTAYIHIIHMDEKQCSVVASFVCSLFCVSGHTCSRVDDDFYSFVFSSSLLLLVVALAASSHFFPSFLVPHQNDSQMLCSVSLRFSFFVYKLLVITMKLTENYPLEVRRERTKEYKRQTRPSDRQNDRKRKWIGKEWKRKCIRERRLSNRSLGTVLASRASLLATKAKQMKIKIASRRAQYAHKQFIVFGWAERQCAPVSVSISVCTQNR